MEADGPQSGLDHGGTGRQGCVRVSPGYELPYELCENFSPCGKCESEGDRERKESGKKGEKKREKKKGKKVPGRSEADGRGLVMGRWFAAGDAGRDWHRISFLRVAIV